jgi:esterase/lipase superfamily enzyme
MEMLIFGHAGFPALVFPNSCGRFFEFEDRGMVHSIHDKIKHGNLQLFCVDSVDSESWYNGHVSPRSRIARHLLYEQYILQEVLPFIRKGNKVPNLATIGCSLGGYHAANIAFRHPDIFHSVLTLGGAFDPSCFLNGYFDEDLYFHLPTHYLPNLTDSRYLDQYRHNTYVFVTGDEDICRTHNEQLHQILRSKNIPSRLDVWGDHTGHDWPWWQRMLQTYL